MSKTLEYYNKNADEYIKKSHTLDMTSTLDKFINSIPANSHILEIGTGSGRDAIYFSNKGFRVTTIEPSSVLAEKAQENIRNESSKHMLVDVVVSSWQAFEPKEKYDAVYAMASLLHLPKDEMKDALKKCVDVLDENGKLFVSLKAGKGESTDELGREFSYYEKEELQELLKDITKKEKLNIEFDGKDALGRANLQWLNIEYQKPALVNENKPKTNKP